MPTNPYLQNSYGPFAVTPGIPDVPPTGFSLASTVLKAPFKVFNYALDVLDTPRNVLANVLSGDVVGAAKDLVPFGESVFGLDVPKVSGRDLLEQYGFIGPNEVGKFDAGDVAGFGADVLLDPITYLSVGLSAAGKAEKAAQVGLARIESASKLINRIKTAEKILPEALRTRTAFLESVAKEEVDHLKLIDKDIVQSVTKSTVPEREVSLFGQQLFTFRKELKTPKLLKFLPEDKVSKELYDLEQSAIRAARYDVNQQLGQLHSWFKDRGKTEEELSNFLERYFAPSIDPKTGQLVVKSQIDLLYEVDQRLNELMGDLAPDGVVEKLVKTTKKTKPEPLMYDPVLPMPEAAPGTAQAMHDFYSESYKWATDAELGGKKLSKKELKDLQKSLAQPTAKPGDAGFIGPADAPFLTKLSKTERRLFPEAAEKLNQYGRIYLKDLKDQLGKRLDALKTMEAQWSPEEIGFLRDIYTKSQADLVANLQVGVRERVLKNPNMGYIMHLVTPEGKQFLLDHKEFQEQFFKKLDTAVKENYNARARNMDGTIRSINEFVRNSDTFKTWAAKKNIPVPTFKYFEDNLFKAAAARANSASGHFYKAVHMQTLFDNFAQEMGSREDFISLAQFIKRENFRRWGDVKIDPKWTVGTIKSKLAEAGHDINLGIKKEIYDDALQPYKVWGKEHKFWRAYDRVHNFYKGMFTVLFPQFHARNLTGNLWNSVVLGGGDIGSHIEGAQILQSVRKGIKEANDPLKYLSKEQADIYQKAASFGIFRDEAAYRAQEFDLGDIALRQNNLFEKSLAAGFDVSHTIESGSRLGHFMGRMKAGDTAATAAASVRKYLFNYDELSQFEKKVMKRGIFFYTFTRKNTPLVIEHMINPWARGWASLVGKTGEKPKDMPDWMWESNMIFQGMDESGRVKGMNLGLPINDPFQTLSRPLSMVTPLLMGPLENMANYDFFKGRPLSEDTVAPKLIQSLQAVSKDYFGKNLPEGLFDDLIGLRVDRNGVVRVDPEFKSLLKVSPFGRLFNTDFSTPKKAAATLGTPFSFSFGTPDKATNLQQRSIDAAKARGEIRPFEIWIGSTPRGKKMAKYLNQ